LEVPVKEYEELYQCVYSKSLPVDRDWHQLYGAIYLIDNELAGEESVAVGEAIISTVLHQIQFQGGWPYSYYLLFAESWRSLNSSTRIALLNQIIPKLASAMGSPGTLWFLDAAVEHKMYPLLHLSFIETALFSPDVTLRSYAAYLLVQIPVVYWVNVNQQKRRSELVEFALNDSAEQVGNEIRKSSGPAI
tara:strand:+ start:445 stop:1017 length:573 start_codon:yes stop_codon:yes gene_type:complete